MNDKKIRVVFAGTGGMGQAAHLKNYATNPECEVVALAEIREDVGKKVAAKYSIPKVYTDIGEMLKKEKFDAVVASQPFGRHGIILPEIMAYGKPVFTEKPIAGSIEVAEKVIAAAKKHKVMHMVGYHKRSDPAVAYAKAEIDSLKKSGELGKMKYVRITMPAGDWIAEGFYDMLSGDNPKTKFEWDPPAKDMDKKHFDLYTAFVNYYIHQVNLMRHLLGEKYSLTYADPSDVLIAGLSESKVPCSIEMSPYVTSIDWQESALVCFEKGWIKIELPAPLTINHPGKVTVFKDPGKGIVPLTVVPDLPWVSAMRQQAANFIKAVREGSKPLCDGEEALLDIKLAGDYMKLRYNV